ncbi:formate dehydrogenase accessory sulfurtransferase FdhD [Phytoactinopolyspora sp. XMNu-373]|uniref:Sulfur carrier protein FdhD n=2 Tax=Phytoactinopolyspora mesophila TaxID=2650750 RepID=A0A7K3M8U5_9ACTN|nr:formate dehydrogenase accessory sulfurtransferase FdhD [Phytoactinopolyspora mesophila]NDL59735.1 formate dehydrogenase accessory sulfurtransferase FdhD [Phytoactinopolyspora mesophila]
MTTRQPVLRLRAGRAAQRPDTLAIEEPLIVRVGGENVTLTMRTPGQDFDLVAGWLVSEGVVAAPADIVAMRMCQDEENTVEVRLAPDVAPPRPRAFATTSACGVCGADSVEAVRTSLRWPILGDDARFDVGVLSALPDLLRSEQKIFDRTGGLHAAGLFTSTGECLVVREDVGRHNAVDKVVGSALRGGRLPLAGHVLQVSGRASFELVHKAAVAGIPVIAAVSAPSSLAVDLAAECGLTLLGFVRGGGMNVYTHQERVRVGPFPRQRNVS